MASQPPSPLAPSSISDPDLAKPPPTLKEKIQAFVRTWARHFWLDFVCMAVTGGLTYGIYQAPIPVTRHFPITFHKSGDIVWPDMAFHNNGWVLPSAWAGVLSILGPVVILCLAQYRVRSIWDLNASILGILWAVIIGSLFHVFLKTFAGGFRPDFLEVCNPNMTAVWDHTKHELTGEGFHHVMFNTTICQQQDRWALKTAVTSFPSGHSTTGFAGYGFLFLWLNAKLKVWADHRPKFWKLIATMAPMLGALMIACTLTNTQAHHWYDILGGSILGVVSALASYRASYASVWDWRYNHLHLRGTEAFPYDGEVDLSKRTFTRSAGWGGDGRDWFPDERAGLGLGTAREAGGGRRRVAPEGDVV